MKLAQTQVQVQKQILAPLMQQSMEVLMLPLLELEQTIDQELETNPLLEVAEPAQDEDARALGPEDSIDGKIFDETLQHEIDRLMDGPEHPYFGSADEVTDHMEHYLESDSSLEDRLICQLHTDFRDPVSIRIGELIIGDLNEDGYLTMDAEEIAVLAGGVDPSRVEEVLKKIQTYDPPGIAARSLKECLLVQARVKFNGHAALAVRIIEGYLDALGHKRFMDIARGLGVSVDSVRESAQLIGALEPKPARNFRPLPPNHYVRPDISVVRDTDAGDDAWRAEVNQHGIPRLRVNALYRALLKQNTLSPAEKTFIRERLTQAIQFIKSIELRGTTLKQIADFILDKQQGFFTHGHWALSPMKLSDVADALGRNESTICRAIQHKYMDTPQGILPLKYFFSQGIGETSASTGLQVSNRSIKEEIQELVAQEDRRHPLSDQEIITLLAQRGISVARRTISKYRQQLNILPSHLRKV